MSKMPSTTGGQKRFATTPSVDTPRSVFDRSCGLKTTFDSGLLVPIFADEAIPGDTMNLRAHTFARMSTPIHPVMDNMRLTTFFFAVPIRLLWENWERFNGAQDNPGDSIDFTVPQVESGGGLGWASNELFDYLGMPPGVPNLSASAFWSRAYNLIWNTHFRDQNLQQSIVVDTDDGPDDPADYVLKRRGKRHDYFTSCLPWPQKGDAVTLPLADNLPVIPTGDEIPTFDIGDTGNTHWLQGGNLAGNGANWTDGFGATPLGDAHWDDPKLEVDLSAATAVTINTLRQSFAFQKILERDARGGTRYVEMIKSHFGVTSPDQRLQRPEYLGGGSQLINTTPVPQTSETDGSPQGNLAAYATSSGSGHTFVKSFTEHCVVLGLACVTADLNYQQGMPRMFKRETRYDFYLPALAHLGEQAVMNEEIYAQGNLNDNNVFGYQERWAEMRYKPSMTTGLMRSQHPLSLDTWHVAQEFSSLPLLGDTFIQENPPIDRVVAVPSEPEFLFDAFFSFKHARPMPAYSVPGQIDRF